jgi:hypothetical protein
MHTAATYIIDQRGDQLAAVHCQQHHHQGSNRVHMNHLPIHCKASSKQHYPPDKTSRIYEFKLASYIVELSILKLDETTV